MTRDGTMTLVGALWPADRQRLLRNVALVVFGSLLLTLSAKTKIPLGFVDATMQPLAVIALALALGRNLAVATVLFYLAQGAAGLPVFTGTPEKGLGLAYMAGPTGGYLAGFVLAAIAAGWLADKGWSKSFALGLGAAAIGLAAIYGPGVAWLSGLIGFEKAIQFGVLPFVVKDMVAAALAGLLVPALWAMTPRSRR
jgi:biotin transport system substrate-specific component